MESERYTDENTIGPIQTLDELIAELHKVFEQDKVNVDYVKALMSAYKSNRSDWKKFAKFDPYKYTRNLVDSGNGKFNLMALCWGEGNGSSIHDHADAHCFVKVLQGQLKETQFEWPKDSEGETSMLCTGTQIYPMDSVSYICDEIGLHRMENPSNSEPAVSLHLYSPPFKSCDTFDEKTGHKREVKMTFWSKYGKRTTYGKDGAPGTEADPSVSSSVSMIENN